MSGKTLLGKTLYIMFVLLILYDVLYGTYFFINLFVDAATPTSTPSMIERSELIKMTSSFLFIFIISYALFIILPHVLEFLSYKRNTIKRLKGIFLMYSILAGLLFALFAFVAVATYSSPYTFHDDFPWGRMIVYFFAMFIANLVIYITAKMESKRIRISASDDEEDAVIDYMWILELTMMVIQIITLLVISIQSYVNSDGDSSILPIILMFLRAMLTTALNTLICVWLAKDDLFFVENMEFGDVYGEEVWVSTEANSKFVSEQLRDYKALLDDGVITEEEYEQKKKQILNVN